MKKLGFILLLGLFLFYPADASAEREPGLSQYTTGKGIDIISYVETWTGERLVEIGSELSNNIHGVEMEYLDRIEIHPGLEPGGNEHVSASYRRENKQLHVPVKLSGFLPDDYQLKININVGVIDIYRGDEKEDIKEIALDLSHEYGHHFSFFYFGDSFNPEEYKNSAYYKVRQLKNYKEVNGSSSYEDHIHRWSIFEIAAEDYKQLLGSKTGKSITRFLDISQKVGRQTYRPVNSVSRLDYNAIPQENWMIPLAAQVEGLYDYFMSFLENEEGRAVEADAKTGTVFESSPFISDTQLGEKLPVLTYREEEHHGFRKGIIAWRSLDPLAFEGADEVVYTLVAYTDDQLFPIKTIYPGEDNVAQIGTVTDVQEPFIYYYQDGLDKGTLHFRLYMQFPDGQVIAGDTLTVNFNSES